MTNADGDPAASKQNLLTVGRCNVACLLSPGNSGGGWHIFEGVNLESQSQ
jgi:hypothetical protein